MSTECFPHGKGLGSQVLLFKESEKSLGVYFQNTVNKNTTIDLENKRELG